MAASTAASSGCRSAADFWNQYHDAASAPYTPSPHSATFRYSSRTRLFPNAPSLRARTASRGFRHRLGPRGRDGLAQLPPQRPLLAEPEVLRQLLRDGGRAAAEVAVLQRGGERNPGLLPVDAVVLEEARVLAVHHCPDQPDRDAVERDPVLVPFRRPAPLAGFAHAGLDDGRRGR